MQLTQAEHKAMCDETAALRAQVVQLQKTAEETGKKLAESERVKDVWYADAKAKEKELAEAHSMIDLFPGAPGRQSSEEDSYRRTTYNLSARLAGWMAARTSEHVK